MMARQWYGSTAALGVRSRYEVRLDLQTAWELAVSLDAEATAAAGSRRVLTATHERPERLRMLAHNFTTVAETQARQNRVPYVAKTLTISGRRGRSVSIYLATSAMRDLATAIVEAICCSSDHIQLLVPLRVDMVLAINH